MRYEKMTNEELNTCKYPNLIAEIIESGYSIGTVGKHMGMGKELPEDSPEVWGRLKGEVNMAHSERKGLCDLFEVDMEYLFAQELAVLEAGKTCAAARWDKERKNKEPECVMKKKIKEIEQVLKRNPELISPVWALVNIDEKSAQKIMQYLQLHGDI